MKRNTKRWKKLVSFSIFMVLIFSMILSGNQKKVLAGAKEYTLNIDLSTYNEKHEGITWDATTNTLTLDNVIINGYIKVPKNRNVTIVVKGDVTIINSENYISCIDEEEATNNTFTIKGENKDNDKLTLISLGTSIDLGNDFLLRNCSLYLKYKGEYPQYYRGYNAFGDNKFTIENSYIHSEGDICTGESRGVAKFTNSTLDMQLNNSSSLRLSQGLTMVNSTIIINNQNDCSLGIEIINEEDQYMNIDKTSKIDIKASTAFMIEIPETADKPDISKIFNGLVQKDMVLKREQGYEGYESRTYAIGKGEDPFVYEDPIRGTVGELYVGENAVTVTGGTCDSTDGKYICDDTITINLNASDTPAGKKLKKWNISPSDTKILSAGGASTETLMLKMNKEPITVTAEYENLNYSIQYFLDGGANNSKNKTTYTVDDEITLYAPTKDDCSFEGWYTNAEFAETSKIDEIALNTTGDLNLYAKFVPNPHTLTVNNGTSDKTNNIFIKGDTVTVTANAPATGKVFKGWKVESGNVELADSSSMVTTFTGLAGDAVLTAEYNNVIYNIEYYLDGGENDENNPLSYTIDDSITLKNPVKAGYDFAGWYKSLEYNENDKISQISNATGDLELYAKFVKQEEQTEEETTEEEITEEVTTEEETTEEVTTEEETTPVEIIEEETTTTSEKTNGDVSTGDTARAIIFVFAAMILALSLFAIAGKKSAKCDK